MKQSKETIDALIDNISTVVLGKEKQIKLVLSCWISGGHILFEDFPGTGKTMLARAVSLSAESEFKRVQFTPDLLPSDILGASIYNQHTNTFQFYKGPIFTTIFLADEINRATPRTQSALLEGMAENQVSIEGETRKLSPLFFVMAIQNPVEQYGTFPLPEAQLDRFMMKVSMGYPGEENEIDMVKNQLQTHPIETLKTVVDPKKILRLRRIAPQIRADDSIYSYILKLVLKTRHCKDLQVGASPRATIALTRCAQAMALIDGRNYVKPNDVYTLATFVLGHRIIPTCRRPDRIGNRNRNPYEQVRSVSGC